MWFLLGAVIGFVILALSTLAIGPATHAKQAKRILSLNIYNSPELMRRGIKTEYYVSSTGAAHVQYTDGHQSLDIDIKGSWIKVVTTYGYYEASVYDTSGRPNAKVACRVVINGAMVKENWGTGAYSRAVCTRSGP